MGKKWMLLGIMAAMMLIGDARTVRAMASSCNTDLLNCYQKAANIDSFWYRWAAGLDCEFSYVECARQTLVGA
jgi:hypothetical protein